MGKRWVVYAATATTVVEIPDDVDATTPAEIRDWADEHFPGVSVCHQCSRYVSLSGDFEADTVVTADGQEHDVSHGGEA
ncbi:hypothetical protein SEA_PHLOP_7 [Gordonia phage Phlop]|uniref:Uncharacterized protein n=3 Tax=Wizardvirus TaxID=2169658 RepID=A0A890US76_9CAUD|nr:hypothetical protein BH794_gp07 [Gordonia phage Wizard]YP_010104221.1 hypothetical protein KNU74_gp07 [Gordonia phage Fireball]YP_010114926.1 hypothetical protein KNV78_gp07 [Gordonia phage Phlop]UVK63719.1 hypothetical protein SEA_PULLUMCAVEA_7 [Gordonia phage PullumCavea]ANA85313.1 hypothetical protein WIZARD_7 [Gordonia phage Wizard]QFP95832.1 hypothetical protein SEA_FIREBALL_7 [Gordonia phage Fireball]QRI44970.1 hypothetical protein SEA_PHLOP_7 [Gordonia phage Phlop]